MIIREHLFKPIQGKVLCLGRQTISMTYDQLIELLKQENYPLPRDCSFIKITKDQKTLVGKGSDYVSDDVFFRFLGMDNVRVMDISKYEGADVIHNINMPIPEELVEQFDFIIDGGTFDHLVDVRMAFENVIKLLKPNGRIFQWNAASNFTGAAYVSFGPDLFYDYYVLNGFADCKVYIAEVDRLSQPESWNMYEFNGAEDYGHFTSNRILMVIVLAEKKPTSTYNKIPVQVYYRDKDLQQEYRERQKSIALSSRKSLLCSRVNEPIITCESKTTRVARRLTSRLAKKGGAHFICKRLLEMPFDQNKLSKTVGFKYIGKL
jgi:SAM-dependent methyltransferase